MDLPSVRPFASRARKAGARAAGCDLDCAALANSPWWPKLEQLGGTVREIPRPKHAVLSLHGRKVEPFLNHGMELIAMLLPKRN